MNLKSEISELKAFKTKVQSENLHAKVEELSKENEILNKRIIDDFSKLF